MVQLHFFTHGYPVFQNYFLKRLSFPHWIVLTTLLKIIWLYMERIYFWAFFFIPLPLCQYHTIFITIAYLICFKIKKWSQGYKTSNFVLFWDCFGCLGSLEISYEFYNRFFSISTKNITGILVGIALNL